MGAMGAIVGDDSRTTAPGLPVSAAAELAAAGYEEAVEVGRGAFGVVYRCQQVALSRVVAVKVLSVGLAEERARFAREQQAMARLTGHPNILPVLNVGETASGYSYLVMPFCSQGCTQERIDRLGVLEVAEVLRLGVKMAGALACAHEAGIVHRDVTPGNILYTDYGEPALCDFGVARVAGGFKTETGVLTGSPAFTAPEILTGAVPNAASDVYGLGASLYCALTGHADCERRSAENLVGQLMRVTGDPVPNLRRHNIPDAVARVVAMAMARDPAGRPSAIELGELIRTAQAHLGLPITEMRLHKALQSDRLSLAAVPASVSGGGAGGRLPATVASFVGREAELTQLHELLTTSRLLTLVGIGGVGKTTLAAHAAAKLRPQFTHGVWWVELAELRDGGLLTEVVAAALGVRDQRGRTLTDVLIEFLEQRHTLVVLDNCEHLVDDVATLVDTLLRHCQQLQILATSREVLDIDGEALLRLSPLSCPALEANPTLRTVGGYEAVQLFVQRARAVLPGFELDDHNATAIADICARLDGLPLAIELAAARLRAMSAEQIAEELNDRFSLLSQRRRGTLARRQSLAACVEWSYELCTEAEQQLWCRLSVLAETFDLPTARGICGSDFPDIGAHEFLDLLCTLVDKSVLIRVEHHGVACFRLLDTLRDYAKSRITETERLRLARCHAAWYHQLLTDAEAQWFTGKQLHWIQRLSAELPNIREALNFSLTDCPAMAVDMTAALRLFWVYQAVVSEGYQWANRALAAIPPEPSVARIRALFTVAHLALGSGELVTGLGWLAKARELLEVVDEPVTRGRIDFYDGYVAMLAGDLDRARGCLQRAVAATDDFETQAYSMSAMGWLDLASGDPSAALFWSEKGHVLAESHGDWSMRAVTLGSVGAAHWRLGNLDRAEELLHQGLQLALAFNDNFHLAIVLEVLAWISESRGQPRLAVVLIAAATKISQAGGTRPVLGFMEKFYTECERNIREQLGAEEFQTAWDEGTALKMSDIAKLIELQRS
jgi:serine/threonine-protein kinase PknK